LNVGVFGAAEFALRFFVAAAWVDLVSRFRIHPRALGVFSFFPGLTNDADLLLELMGVNLPGRGTDLALG